MPVRVKLYILAGFLIQPSLKYYDDDFINMQFSCQRNLDLIELPRQQVLSREDGEEVEATMHTITVKLIFLRN